LNIPILHIYYPRNTIKRTLKPADIRSRIIAQLIDGVVLGVIISGLLLLFSKGRLYSLWISPIIPIYIVQTSYTYIPLVSDWWWGGYYIKISLPFIADFLLAYPSPLQWLVYIAYYTLFHYFWGQTPGKMMKGLVVLTIDQHPLTFNQSLKRWFMYLISLIPFGIGFFLTSHREQFKSWHDRLTRTRVFSFDTFDSVV